MRSITIKDIARQAGVAASTVSAVLNGKSRQMRISEHAEEKIIHIARQLGYRPNHHAVSLRTGKSRVLGLIVEDISNIFFGSLAKIIEEEADAIGFKVLYCSTENNTAKARERLRMLMQHQVAGFLLTPAEHMQQELQDLIDRKKPVVLVDRYFPEIDLPYVVVDNYQGVQEGVTHLIQAGYKKIAFITVDLHQIQMELRRSAWQDTVTAAGMDTANRLLELPYHLKPEAATEQIRFFLQQANDIDAVFFATNYLGVYGLEAIKQLGWQIPEKLGVICFDDNDIFRFHSPGITVIRQPVEKIAQMAMRMLADQLNHTELVGSGRQMKLCASLVHRGSVKNLNSQ